MRPFVDAFNATDNPAAHAHCSPLAVSIALQQAGAEPIMQLVCRDRNRLALGSGHYLSGRRTEPAPHFFIGAVENPGAPPFEYRVRRAAKKALAGARFLQLQLCSRPALLERFMPPAWD